MAETTYTYGFGRRERHDNRRTEQWDAESGQWVDITDQVTPFHEVREEIIAKLRAMVCPCKQCTKYPDVA